MFKTYAGIQAGGSPAPIAAPAGAKNSLANTGQGWTPSAMYMFALVIAEIVAVAFLSKKLR
jgi:hypothetical protein